MRGSQPQALLRPATAHSLLSWLGLAALLAFQAFAYAFRLPLSLGPRFILQPWLIRQGFIIYEDIADLHTPLAPMMMACVQAALASHGLRATILVTILLLTLTTILTFLAARAAAGEWAGLWAASFVVLWSPAFSFGKLWYESFLAPLYLLWLMTYSARQGAASRNSLLVLGVLGGAAVMIKQQAILVFAAVVLWQIRAAWLATHSYQKTFHHLAWIGLGACLPWVAFIVYQLTRAGTLSGFFFWTIAYPLGGEYRELASQPPTTRQFLILASSAALLPLAFIYPAVLRRRGMRANSALGLGLAMLALSCATAYPRFNAFHLQAALPLLAWASSLGAAGLLRLSNRWRPVLLALIALLSAFWLYLAGPAYLPVLQARPSRPIFEYSDLQPLATQIKPHLSSTESIYIFPDDESTSNLYYILQRTPPSFWVFHYPWYMGGKQPRLSWINARILAELSAHPPDWVIYFPQRAVTWQVQETAPDLLAFIQSGYSIVVSLHWSGGEAWLMYHKDLSLIQR